MILSSSDQANLFQLWFIDVEPRPSPQVHAGSPPAILTGTDMLYLHLTVIGNFPIPGP